MFGQFHLGRLNNLDFQGLSFQTKFLVEEKGIDARRIQPIGKGEAEPAMWTDANGQLIELTERFINKFRSSDKAKFEKLHQINRRTVFKIVRFDYIPTEE